MYLLLFSLLMIFIEMIGQSPLSLITTDAGNRYSDFSIHAVFTYLGLPFATAMSLIVGAVALLLVKIKNRIDRQKDGIRA